MELSVVLPVRNGEAHLDQAIASILDQSFDAFELIVLDDGSTDGSMELVDRWLERDDRVRVAQSELAPGLANAANEAVRHARSELVARMDADDVSLPGRLQRQVDVFSSRPSCVLCGTLSVGIDARGRVVRPADRSRLLRSGLFVPFPHGSVMFRRAAFDEAGGYRESCDGWEDLDLWVRMGAVGTVAVVARPLYAYRHTTGSYTAVQSATYVDAVGRRARAEALLERGRPYGELDLDAPLSGQEVQGAQARAAAERAASFMWAGARARRPRAASPYTWMATSAPRLTRRVRRATIRVSDHRAGRRLQTDVAEWPLRTPDGAT